MIDFTVWDSLLQQYVDKLGRVDYHAWKTQQPQTLANDYIRSYLKPNAPLSASTPISYLYYDWSLNQRISS